MSPCISSETYFLKSFYLILTISVALLQFIPPAFANGIRTDWDLAVSHETRIRLKSISPEESLDLTVKTPINKNGYNGVNKGALKLLAADPKRGLIFFGQISNSNDLTSIGVFNVLGNNTTLLHQQNGSISGLVYQNEFLYWGDNRNKSIMRLNTTDFKAISQQKPQPFVSSIKGNIYGLAIHPETGSLFWADWPSDSKQHSGVIHMYDVNTQLTTEVVTRDLYKPKGLFSDGTYLYWADNPVGVYFNISRVLLSDLNQVELLERSENQRPNTLTVVCKTKMYWTETMNRGLYEMDLKSRKIRLLSEFRETMPLSLVSNSLKKCDEVVSDASVPLTLTVGNVTPTENIPAVVVNAAQTDNNIPAVVPNVTQTESIPAGVVNETQNGLTLVANATHTGIVDSGAQEHVENDEVEKCRDWESIPCLNGASCLSVNRKILCLCSPGFTGPNCQYEYYEYFLPPKAMLGLGTGLLALIVLLIVVIIFLAIRIRKLNKKPKIHKRIVVAKSRRRDQTTSSVCEMIDIENCCNMNVCETPCYDRIGPTSTGSKSDKKAAHKEEDKQRLIET